MSYLPWIAFWAVPVFGLTFYPFLLVMTAFMFDSPSVSSVQKFFGYLARATFVIAVIAWIVCHVLYHRGPEHDPMYCWIAIWAFGAHVLNVAAIWVVFFLFSNKAPTR